MPEIDPNRTLRILNGLVERSDAGAIAWEIGGPPDSYAADVGPIRLRVRSGSGEGNPPYFVELLGPRGNNIIFASDVAQIDLQPLIVGLYQRGRQSVLDPDKVLAVVEQQLGFLKRTN